MTQATMFETRRALTERQFQDVLQDGLKREGWLYNHTYRMRTASGAWRTSTTAVGFPDIVAVRPGWVLAIEVKAKSGRLEPGQLTWLRGFHEAGALAWLLRPTDSWQLISNWLHDPGKAPERWGW